MIPPHHLFFADAGHQDIFLFKKITVLKYKRLSSKFPAG